MLRSKIVHLKKIYNFDTDYFLIKRIVFVLIVKNVIKNKKFHFCLIINKYGKIFNPQIIIIAKSVGSLFHDQMGIDLGSHIPRLPFEF